MVARLFALISGLVFLGFGVAGFVPSLMAPPATVVPLPGAEPLGVASGYGLLFGLFPVNALADLLHLLFGVWGAVAWRAAAPARAYARGVAVVFSFLALVGVLPNLADLLRVLPLWGNDVWLNAALAATASAIGFVPWWTLGRGPAGRSW